MRPVLNLLCIVLLAGFLLAACGPAATPVVPTDTPTSPPPTDTPVPTNTPTPEPTATPTPNATATAAALAAQEAERVSTEAQAEMSELGIEGFESGKLAWYQTEPEVIALDVYQQNVYSNLPKDLEAGDFVFRSNVTWDTTGIMVCGFGFRSANESFKAGGHYEHYFYRISGLPAYFIDFYRDNRWQNTITDVRFSDALIQDNGATNEIVFVAKGNEFTVYINGVRQGRYFDYSNQATDGHFAFLGWQESGESTCTFADGWVWVLV